MFDQRKNVIAFLLIVAVAFAAGIPRLLQNHEENSIPAPITSYEANDIPRPAKPAGMTVLSSLPDYSFLDDPAVESSGNHEPCRPKCEQTTVHCDFSGCPGGVNGCSSRATCDMYLGPAGCYVLGLDPDHGPYTRPMDDPIFDVPDNPPNPNFIMQICIERHEWQHQNTDTCDNYCNGTDESDAYQAEAVCLDAMTHNICQNNPADQLCLDIHRAACWARGQSAVNNCRAKNNCTNNQCQNCTEDCVDTVLVCYAGIIGHGISEDQEGGYARQLCDANMCQYCFKQYGQNCPNPTPTPVPTASPTVRVPPTSPPPPPCSTRSVRSIKGAYLEAPRTLHDIDGGPNPCAEP